MVMLGPCIRRRPAAPLTDIQEQEQWTEGVSQLLFDVPWRLRWVAPFITHNDTNCRNAISLDDWICEYSWTSDMSQKHVTICSHCRNMSLFLSTCQKARQVELNFWKLNVCPAYILDLKFAQLVNFTINGVLRKI